MQKRGFVFLPGQELALAGAKNKTPAMAQPCGALFSWAVLPTISGSPNEER